MFKTITTTLVVATSLSLTSIAALASSGSTVTPEISAQIRKTLTEQGYEVRKIEKEDGLYEVYVIKDGARQEIYLNLELQITDRKSDD